MWIAIKPFIWVATALYAIKVGSDSVDNVGSGALKIVGAAGGAYVIWRLIK